MMSAIVRRIGAALAVAAVVACAARQGEGSGETTPEELPQITLEVQNHNFNDATIDAFGAAGRQRIGRVPGNDRASFTFRWTSPDIALRISFLSGGRLETRNMPVVGGEVLELVIERADGSDPLLRRIH